MVDKIINKKAIAKMFIIANDTNILVLNFKFFKLIPLSLVITFIS